MASTTAYQYAKLGSNVEFLRSICSTSMMQTSSLVEFPHLLENLPAVRYSVMRVVEVIKSLLIQLGEMQLATTLQTAEPLRPMLKEMEAYLGRTAVPETAFLNDHFAERLIEIAKSLGVSIKLELASRETV